MAEDRWEVIRVAPNRPGWGLMHNGGRIMDTHGQTVLYLTREDAEWSRDHWDEHEVRDGARHPAPNPFFAVPVPEPDIDREGLGLGISLRVTIAEMESWDSERISAFFAGVAMALKAKTGT